MGNDDSNEPSAVELVVVHDVKDNEASASSTTKHSEKRAKRWLRAVWTVLAMQSWTDFLCAVCFAIALILIMNNATPVYRPVQVYDATLRCDTVSHPCCAVFFSLGCRTAM